MRWTPALAVLALLAAGCSGGSPTSSTTTTHGACTRSPSPDCCTPPGQGLCGYPDVCTPDDTTPPCAGDPEQKPVDNATAPQPAVNATAPSGPPRTWAPLDSAAIRPGVQINSDAGQCTSNFLFVTPDNATVYIGVAAHCVNNSSDATGTATSGCDARNTPFKLGAKVSVDGAADSGILAYTSWGTMQSGKESDADTCAFNDFALIQLSAKDAAKANPAMLKYGGPTRIADPATVHQGDKVLTFGNSGLRMGVEALREKEGYVVAPSSWSTTIYTSPPGVEGDSGSAVILADGQALGDLVTGDITPYPGASGISNLAPELAYMQEHAGITVRLATWALLDAGVLPPV